MVILAVLAWVLGVLVGTFDVQNFLLDALVSNKDLVLYLLMFSVGMSIGLHKGIIKRKGLTYGNFSSFGIGFRCPCGYF